MAAESFISLNLNRLSIFPVLLDYSTTGVDIKKTFVNNFIIDGGVLVKKVLYFFGVTPSPLYLSRRWPLVTAINWLKALFSPSYARAVTTWLRYRLELFDGLQG